LDSRAVPRTGDGGGFREEVINVKLAELLSKREVLAVPETIVRQALGGRRLPDIITAQFFGIRVVIEGKIGDQPAVAQQLEDKCEERLEEGIAAIAIGVIYPPEVREAGDLGDLERRLAAADLRIRVFTEAGGGDWVSSDVNGLAHMLKVAYESLVHEDVVKSAVDALETAIDGAVRRLSSTQAIVERLRPLLVLPKTGEEAADDA